MNVPVKLLGGGGYQGGKMNIRRSRYRLPSVLLTTTTTETKTLSATPQRKPVSKDVQQTSGVECISFTRRYGYHCKQVGLSVSPLPSIRLSLIVTMAVNYVFKFMASPGPYQALPLKIWITENVQVRSIPSERDVVS